MLVISRKANEGFWLNEDIHVTVLCENRGQIRIGIDAPREVIVTRDEHFSEGGLNESKSANTPASTHPTKASSK